MNADQQNKKSSMNIPVRDENLRHEADPAPGPADPAQGTDDPPVEAAAPPSADELAALREEAAKARDFWDRFVRLNADFDNFKKRAAKDRLDAIKYANEALVEKLLPVMDNFEAALTAGGGSETASLASLLTGVKMIATQLKGVLAEAGLEEIDAAGKVFDPTIHEALSQQPTNDVPEGHVLQQVRKGYRLKDRLVRPAAVVVAVKPGEGGSEGDAA